MKTDEKINLALGLGGLGTVLAIVALIFMFMQPRTSATAGTVEEFYEQQARELGLRKKAFAECRASDEALAKVDADINEILTLTDGRVGTPFSIATTPGGIAVPVSGALPQELFEIIIDIVKRGDLDELQALYDQVYAGQGDIPDVHAFDGMDLRPFNPEEDHYRGSTDAEVFLIEYSDYQCPYCAQVHPTMKELSEGDLSVTWVYRHLPLTSIHPEAKPAAIAAECIAELEGEEAFWSFTDHIYEDQSVLAE